MQYCNLLYCRLSNINHIFSSARLPYTVQKPVRTGFVLNNRNTIDINCAFKRLQPLHFCSRRREPSISINSIVSTISPVGTFKSLDSNIIIIIIWISCVYSSECAGVTTQGINSRRLWSVFAPSSADLEDPSDSSLATCLKILLAVARQSAGGSLRRYGGNLLDDPSDSSVKISRRILLAVRTPSAGGFLWQYGGNQLEDPSGSTEAISWMFPLVVPWQSADDY